MRCALNEENDQVENDEHDAKGPEEGASENVDKYQANATQANFLNELPAFKERTTFQGSLL